MGVFSGNCHVCGKFIPPSDFERRRAVVLLKRRYCHDCSDAITGGAPVSRASASTFQKVSNIAGLLSQGWRSL